MILATTKFAALAAAALLAVAAPADSQVPASPALAYADLADLSLTAPIAAHARIAGTVASTSPV